MTAADKVVETSTSVYNLTTRCYNQIGPCMSAMSYRLAHEGPPAHYRPPTMDELPVPCGSWQENYDNNQRKYNIVLLLGVGFFLITFSVGCYTGTFDLYLMAPKRPSASRTTGTA